jgi:hypothetical protein
VTQRSKLADSRAGCVRRRPARRAQRMIAVVSEALRLTSLPPWQRITAIAVSPAQCTATAAATGVRIYCLQCPSPHQHHTAEGQPCLLSLFFTSWSQLPRREASPPKTFTCLTPTVARLISPQQLHGCFRLASHHQTACGCRRADSAECTPLQKEHVCKTCAAQALNLRHVLSHHEKPLSITCAVYVHRN